MIYIIGDVHGEITKLKKLVENIERSDRSASYVFIGDYLDKGEDVKKTLEYLSDLNRKRECRFLLGNHEYLWLNLDGNDKQLEMYLMNFGGKETLKSLNVHTLIHAKQKLLQNFSSFFNSLHPYWIYNEYVIVHSGIPPEYYKTAINKIPVHKLLFNRYDFIKENKLYLNKYKVIFGHTGFYFPYIDNVKIGIDTAACFLNTQPLTAFCPELNLFIDSDNNKFSMDTSSDMHCPNIVRIKSTRGNAVIKE